jgi:hypothetical protein
LNKDQVAYISQWDHISYSIFQFPHLYQKTYEIAYNSSHGQNPIIHQVTKGVKEELVLPPAGSEITIAKAIEIAEAVGEKGTDDKYLVTGKIKSVTNPQYGEMYITDGENELYIYGTYSKDGVLRYSELTEKPVKGDTVTLLGSLKSFNGSAEMGSGWIQSFEKDDTPFDPSNYTVATVAQARAAEDEDLLMVSGVVANMTYANGMIPSGFYLVDNTGSIYVYDRDIAGQVKVGNTIKVAGEKDFWILETEVNNANKYGYKGCIQLTNPVLVENDNKVSDFNTTWVEESTVKEMLDTPLTENITTNIYKVNALVKKVPGAGFVNYYFFDLDGETGTYAYTQCNGSDFEWLDEFDGKVCTVYLSIINAKATATG